MTKTTISQSIVKQTAIEASSRLAGSRVEDDEILFGDNEYALRAVAGIEREETILETVERDRVGYIVVAYAMCPEGDGDVYELDESGDVTGEPHWYPTLGSAYCAMRSFQAYADACRKVEFLGSPGPIIDCASGRTYQ